MVKGWEMCISVELGLDCLRFEVLKEEGYSDGDRSKGLGFLFDALQHLVCWGHPTTTVT